MRFQTSKSLSPNKNRAEWVCICVEGSWRFRLLILGVGHAWLGSVSASWFVSQLNIFSTSWNLFNLADGLWISATAVAIIIQSHERARSVWKVSALPALVVIQVTEVEKRKPCIGKDLFSFCMCVMYLCYAKLVWWPCFSIQPRIWAIPLHPSPLSINQAVKPCKFECHHPSLVFFFSQNKAASHPHLPPVVQEWKTSSSNWEEKGRVTSPCSHRTRQHAC